MTDNIRLIFDCGGTKISAGILYRNTGPRVMTLEHGYNALSAPAGLLTQLLGPLGETASGVNEIHFYGAGCVTSEACGRVREELLGFFPECTDIEVASDMLGAARALCGTDPGIACILGTGANSCMYDGERITANTPSLGYILGDEGSGAVLGRLLLGRIFKRQFPGDILEAFHHRYSLSAGELITRVYRSERPNSYLASFAPFLSEHIGHPAISLFVEEEFRRFLRYNVLAYAECHDHPVHFIGSIAEHFTSSLHNALKAENLIAGRIMKSPMPALLSFHCRQHHADGASEPEEGKSHLVRMTI